MTDPLTVGLLGHAKRWSLVGLLAGVGIVVSVGTLNLVFWFMGEQQAILVPMHSWTLAGLTMLVVCSFGTQLVARQMIYMRKLKFALKAENEVLRAENAALRASVAELGELVAELRRDLHHPVAPRQRRRRHRAGSGEVVSLPSAETVAAVRRLAAKVTGEG